MHPKSSDSRPDPDSDGSWVGERRALGRDAEPGSDRAHGTPRSALAPDDPPPPESEDRVSVSIEEAEAIFQAVEVDDGDALPLTRVATRRDDEPEDGLDVEELDIEPLETAEPETDGGEPARSAAPGLVEDADPENDETFTPSIAGAYEIEEGRIIDGRYQVQELLGTGAVGLVFRCRHLVLDKDVAIKVLRPDFARDKEVAGRLVLEAKAASAIGSPHIVETIDFGRLLDGSAFFVMEYLDGESLAQLIDRRARLHADEVLHIALQITEALGEAHRAGIIHRDLKPDNVFLITRGGDRRFVKVLDFGIAKLARAESKLTRSGRVYGTPHYMSPEQAGGRPTDERTDVYALGVILFELLAGSVPFDAEEPMGILTQHLYDEPPEFDAVRLEGIAVIPGAEAVVRRCLAKAPEERYQTMGDLRDDLERLRAGAVPVAVSTPPPPRVDTAPPPAPSAAARGAYVVAALGVVVSGALGYALYVKRDPPEAPVASASAVVKPLSPVAQEAPAPRDPSVSTDPRGSPVILVVLPADAKIFRGRDDLGPMPVTVHVPDGEKVRLAIRRDGFISRRLTLDGKRRRVVVGLVPKHRKSSGPKESERRKDIWQEAEAAADRAAAEHAETLPGLGRPPGETPARDSVATDPAARRDDPGESAGGGEEAELEIPSPYQRHSEDE